VFTIVGNHDVQYGRVDDVDNTSLGVLFKAGAVAHLKRFEIDDVVITGVDYGTDASYVKPLSSKEDGDQYNICVAHQFYEAFGFGSEVLLDKEVIDVKDGFDAFVLGHDHSYSKPVHLEHTSIYRCGGLSRMTSAESDVSRNVKILSFDLGERSFEEIEIECLPVDECFSQESLDKFKNALKRSKEEMSQSLEEVLANMNFNVKSSIYDVLDEVEMPDDVRQRIETYLSNAFIVRLKTEEE